MAKTQTRTVLVSSQSLAAGATVRGRIDLTGVDSGFVTFRITNGATGPTVQCVGRILVAHKDTAMPALASEGVGDLDWKQIYEIGGGTAANGTARGYFPFGSEMSYLEVEFTGNTAQSVTVEAHVTTTVY